MSKIQFLVYLDVMGEHGEVHAAPGGQAEAGHGVDRLVAPDPEPGPAPELAPPAPGLGDQVEAGDGHEARHQQLGQPEVSSGAVVDVDPAGHVQVRPERQKVSWDILTRSDFLRSQENSLQRVLLDACCNKCKKLTLN